MRKLYGFNRRQAPLELVCPGGRISLERLPHGTVRVRFTAEAGELAFEHHGWRGSVTLRHEANGAKEE